MEITQKKKPPGSLDNLHPGIEPQSTGDAANLLI